MMKKLPGTQTRRKKRKKKKKRKPRVLRIIRRLSRKQRQDLIRRQMRIRTKITKLRILKMTLSLKQRPRTAIWS